MRGGGRGQSTLCARRRVWPTGGGSLVTLMFAFRDTCDSVSAPLALERGSRKVGRPACRLFSYSWNALCKRTPYRFEFERPSVPPKTHRIWSGRPAPDRLPLSFRRYAWPFKSYRGVQIITFHIHAAPFGIRTPRQLPKCTPAEPLQPPRRHGCSSAP